MNMQAKSELFCPQLPKFTVSDDIEVNEELVYFSLEFGCIVIECSMYASSITKTRELSYIPNHYGSNYQYEDYRVQEYQQLTVDDYSFVTIESNDNTDIPNGLQISLTESQVIKLNSQLEYLAEENADAQLKYF